MRMNGKTFARIANVDGFVEFMCGRFPSLPYPAAWWRRHAVARPSHEAVIHPAIADERPLAQAIVIIEATPRFA
jgi:hypothetical protein